MIDLVSRFGASISLHYGAVARSVLETSPLPEPSTSPVPRQEAIELNDKGRVDLDIGAESVTDGVDGYVELCCLRCDRAYCPGPAPCDTRPFPRWRPSVEHGEVQAVLLA